MMNEFYAITGSNLSKEELKIQLDLKEIPVPIFKVSDVARIALKKWI